MSNFPNSVDDGTTLPNPNSTDKTNSPSHASLHGVENDAIKALEIKLGTGATTPRNNTLLRGNGSGTSTWSTLTSAQLAASISDATGTGAAVFGTAPTLATPKVDTINESTLGNGTTIGGVNIKSGALATSNSVVTTNIADANVTAPKMNNSGTWNSSWATTQWTPTITGFSSTPTGGLYYYTQVGKQVTLFITQPNDGTSNVNTFTITLPVTARTIANMGWSGAGQIKDNSSLGSVPGLLLVTSGANTMSVYTTYAGGIWTTSGSKRLIYGTITYEAA